MPALTSYTLNDKIYKVVITRKKMKNIRYRLRDDTFYISAPYLASNASIEKGLVKFAPYLVNKLKPASEGKDFNYIFGFKYDIGESGEIKILDDKIIKFSSRYELHLKLKKVFLSLVSSRVRYFENLMGLCPHNVRVRDMKTRYGSNSKKTRTVCFASSLYHYSVEIIDAIVVHELSHTIHFDHSPAFYNVVYKYCPKYDILHKKLRKGIHL